MMTRRETLLAINLAIAHVTALQLNNRAEDINDPCLGPQWDHVGTNMNCAGDTSGGHDEQLMNTTIPQCQAHCAAFKYMGYWGSEGKNYPGMCRCYDNCDNPGKVWPTNPNEVCERHVAPEPKNAALCDGTKERDGSSWEQTHTNWNCAGENSADHDAQLMNTSPLQCQRFCENYKYMGFWTTEGKKYPGMCRCYNECDHGGKTWPTNPNEVCERHHATNEAHAFLDWRLCDRELTHNNLGGLGPVHTDPEEMRFAKVTKLMHDGHEVDLDLVVTVADGYQAHNIDINKLDRCFGFLNVKRDSEAKLKFTFTAHGEKSPYEHGFDFRFTVYDVDNAAKNDNKEVVIFSTPVAESYLDKDTELVQSGDNTVASPLTFKSSTIGNGSDNPTDPRLLDEHQRQRAVEVEYRGINEWEAIFAVEGGGNGRNFMWAGASDVPEPELVCEGFPEASVHWRLCDHDESGNQISVPLLSNNLGGSGPTNGPEELRYGSVLELPGGASLDLVVTVKHTTSGKYTPWNPVINGIHKCFGVINVPHEDAVTLDFSFQHATSHEPYKFGADDKFVFSVYDVDHSNVHGQEEVVTFDTPFESNKEPGSDLRVVAKSPFTIASNKFGSGADNPYYDYPLFTPQNESAGSTALSLNRSMEVQYAAQHTWTVTFESKGGNRGRNILFGGCQHLHEKK